jgi:hypothetical protein
MMVGGGGSACGGEDKGDGRRERLRDRRFRVEGRKEPRDKAEIRDMVRTGKGEELLDKFEAAVELKAELKDDVIEIFEEEAGAKAKLTTTLREHYDHWRDTGASNFCLGVIREGYIPKLEGCEEDFRYEEENNKSYKENKVFANGAVEEMKKFGVVKAVDKEECRFINPLTVATNKKGKKRLCIDLSRGLNKFTSCPKFKIRSLKEVRAAVERDDYGCSFDLRSFYHQVPVSAEFQRCLGFKISGEDGSCEYFQYTMLPFGFNDATRIVTKLLKRPLARWRGWGARVAEVHIDDGILFTAGREEMLELSRRVREDLIRYGLLISEDKCSWGARRRLEWVGFQWDTRSWKLFLPREKLERVEAVVEALRGREGERIPIKDIASCSSLIESCRPAIGEMARFRTRAMLMLVVQVEQMYGWGGWAELSPGAVAELDYWRRELRRLNGSAIRVEPGVVAVRHERRYVSDAGEYMVGGVEWTEGGRKRGTEYKVHLTERQQKTSSTEREMIGILTGLRLSAGELRRSAVRWTCDNWGTSIINRVGSMVPALQRLAVEIWELCQENDIKIEWDWQPRTKEEVRYADGLSKDFDMGDYCIAEEDFIEVERRFGPFCCDFFASDFTFRMKPFMSKFRCEGSAGVDAFSAEWNRGRPGYFHPPVDMIVDTVRCARKQKARGVLVTPYWPESSFWAYLALVKGLRMEMKWRPYLVAPGYFRNKTFVGNPKFDFCVFKFDFGRR